MDGFDIIFKIQSLLESIRQTILLSLHILIGMFHLILN